MPDDKNNPVDWCCTIVISLQGTTVLSALRHRMDVYERRVAAPSPLKRRKEKGPTENALAVSQLPIQPGHIGARRPE